MDFWKRSYDLIWKTFLYQVVMSLFGVMMYTATSLNPVLFILGQIAVLAFYAYVLFSQTMKKAAKTAEYDHRHKIRTSPFAGFWLSALGLLPTLALSIFCYFSRPYTAEGLTRGASFALYHVNKLLMQGMYVGLYSKAFPPQETSLYAATAGVGPENAAALNAQATLMPFAVIPAVLICGIAYFWGYRHFLKGSSDFSFRRNGREDSGE